MEELFVDGGLGEPGTQGTNRTGTYVAKVRLHSEIPELVPVDGRRVRISYPGIQILCTNCFGKHHKTKCQSLKTKFTDYMLRNKNKTTNLVAMSN